MQPRLTIAATLAESERRFVEIEAAAAVVASPDDRADNAELLEAVQATREALDRFQREHAERIRIYGAEAASEWEGSPGLQQALSRVQESSRVAVERMSR